MTSFFTHALAALLGAVPTMLVWRSLRKWKRRADFWFERSLIAEANVGRQPQRWESSSREGIASPLTSSQLDELIGRSQRESI